MRQVVSARNDLFVSYARAARETPPHRSNAPVYAATTRQ